MAENDEVSGSDFADTPYVPSGPRRSTYTPPTGNYPPPFLQQEAGNGADAAETPTAPETAASGPEAAAPPIVPEAAPSIVPEPATPAVPGAATPTVPPIVPEAAAVADGRSEPAPERFPDRPHRRSLQDDELVQALSPELDQKASTLDAIEQLQAELELREREAAEFTVWEGRMRAIGTPEALESIAEAIPEFTGVIPIITPEMASMAVPREPAATESASPRSETPAAHETAAAPDGPAAPETPAAHETLTAPETPAHPAWMPPAADASAAPFAPPAEPLVVPPPGEPQRTGTPESIATVFSVDEEPAPSSVDQRAAAEAEPAPVSVQPADVEPSADPFLHPEQFPPPKLEERVDVGVVPDPDLSDHLVLQPPWLKSGAREPAPEQSAPQERSSESEPAGPQQAEAAPSEQSAPQERSSESEPAEPQQAEAAPSEQPASEQSPAEQPASEESPEQPTFGATAFIPQQAESVEAPAAAIATPAAPASDEAPEQGTADTVAPASETPAHDGLPSVPDSQEPAHDDAAHDDASSGEFAENEAPPNEPTTMVQESDPGQGLSAPEAPIIYDLVDPIAPAATSATPVPPVSPFDALLVGDTAETTADEQPKPFSLLHSTPGSEPPPTGSHAIITPVIDSEPDDDVDETDRAFDEAAAAFPVTTEGAIAPPPTSVSAPIEPIATPRAAEEPLAAAGDVKTPVFSIELSGEEATPVERRIGRAARMFWLWFAANSSIVSIAFGAALFGLGMSLRQAILAAFIGVAISFLPLGLGTLAGKWSGQPTIVVSRATFGLTGNIVPAVLAFVTRLFWGAVLLWLIAACSARILVGASLAGPFDEQQLTYVVALVGAAIAFALAFFGYPLFARAQLILTIISAVLIVVLLAVTWHAVDIRAALTVGDGPWILVVTGVVLVFSFVGLVWANSSGDLARYQQPGSSGASASLWASFGATLPAFLLIAYGALLAASNSATATELGSTPFDVIAGMIPAWYPIPLLAATVLSLLSGVALSMYSGGFALQAIGLRLQRQWSVVAVAVVLFAIAILIILSGSDISGIFRDFATSLAVPVAAWAGIFAAEVMIRRRRFHEQSLLTPGGVYPSVNWVNLVMLFVASAIGFAFTSATVGWLSWQGYGFSLLGFPLDGEVAGSDIGVLVALVIGLITPLAAGISTVRRQELAEQ